MKSTALYHSIPTHCNQTEAKRINSQWLLALIITVIGNMEHDQDGDCVIMVYCAESAVWEFCGRKVAADLPKNPLFLRMLRLPNLQPQNGNIIITVAPKHSKVTCFIAF